MKNLSTIQNLAVVTEFVPEVPETGASIEELMIKLATLKAEAVNLADRRKEVESAIKADMEYAGVEKVEAAGHKVYYTTCKRSTFDSKEYAKAHPRVAKRYMKESESTRFTFK